MGICQCCQSNRTILENLPEPAPQSQQECVIVSLYNYPSFGHTELTMCIGERLAIISEYVMQLVLHLHPCLHLDRYKWSRLLIFSNSDGDFVMVRSTTTGWESYIPTNYTAKVTHRWLFTGITRYKAVELLMLPTNQTGAFLIRESETSRDCYSLSVLKRSNASYLDCVKHYRISILQNGWVYISPRLTFPSLHDLVEHYSEFADGLICRLTVPCFIHGLDNATEALPIPTTIRRSTMNWKDISRSVIFRRKRTESDNSLVSEGLREAITSYLQMTEGNDHSWDT